MRYVIGCTYGNMRPFGSQKFATGIKSRKDAEALLALALEKGYSDAQIYDIEEWKAFLDRQRDGREEGHAGRRR